MKINNLKRITRTGWMPFWWKGKFCKKFRNKRIRKYKILERE